MLIASALTRVPTAAFTVCLAIRSENANERAEAQAFAELFEKRTGWKPEDVDLYELNEAFAVQGVAVPRELGIDPARVNVNGGAVALGHPIGATGARIITTLIYALKKRNLKRGVAALCIGGGEGTALALEVL